MMVTQIAIVENYRKRELEKYSPTNNPSTYKFSTLLWYDYDVYAV